MIQWAFLSPDDSHCIYSTNKRYLHTFCASFEDIYFHIPRAYFPKALAIDALGNVYVTGQSGPNTSEEDYATVKYNANGEEQWAARYTSSDFDHRAFDLALDVSGNVYVTGQSDENYVTVKYNTNGVQQWVAKGK